MSDYPRALYFRGVAGEMRAVRNVAEEAEARAEGWLIYGEAPPAEPAADLPPVEMSREDLMSVLESRGIQFDRRWGVARLQDLLG